MSVGNQFAFLDTAPFKESFIRPGERTMSSEPDYDRLLTEEKFQQHLRAPAENIATHFERAKSMGLFDEGLNYYPREHAGLVDIGSAFNARRNERGFKPYFEHDPALAGALLSSQYSQNTNEEQRKRLIARSVETGEAQPHLATKTINRAIDEDIHPLLATSRLKLRDYTGSQLFPHTWDGTFNGSRLGRGYTIDRHQHDIMMDQAFGGKSRGISGGDTGERRYRIFQAAHEMAQGLVDPHFRLSRPAFQAVPWGSWRGSYD